MYYYTDTFDEPIYLHSSANSARIFLTIGGKLDTHCNVLILALFLYNMLSSSYWWTRLLIKSIEPLSHVGLSHFSVTLNMTLH